MGEPMAEKKVAYWVGTTADLKARSLAAKKVVAWAGRMADTTAAWSAGCWAAAWVERRAARMGYQWVAHSVEH